MENNIPIPPMIAPQSGFQKYEKKHFDKVALIDADKIKHLVAYDVGRDLKNNETREPKKLAGYIETRIGEVFNQFSAKGYIFCFSGKSYDTFRTKIAFDKEYKGNRKDDPSYYEGKIEDMTELVSTVMKSYPTLIFSDLEADDVISMLQNENTFVVSNDKDLKQIPGLHFCFERRELITVSQEEAFENLCYQMIVGDSTDNISGLKGFGPKTAQKMFNDVPLKRMPQRILEEYQKVHGLTNGIDAFVETWNLIKLRTSRGDYLREKYAEAFNLLNLIILNSK